MNIEFKVERLQVSTCGLGSVNRQEIGAEVEEPSLIPDCKAFLQFVADYLARENGIIKTGETLAYGYWVTKFVGGANQSLIAWEYNSHATEFVPGISLTLRFWRSQHETCAKAGAEFCPPRPDLLAVVSDGVFEGDPVEGVRYPSPPHMSGWWFTTNRYNGDIKTLRCEHLYHLTAKRFELSSYLALPFGYRFVTASNEVWFDEEVARSSLE